MAETMEQYMRKTRADYGSAVVRPKIKDNDSFELKGQFLKELRTNTFSSSNHEDANEHIEKVLEIVDLFHIPNITIDQVMLGAFPMSLTGAVLQERGFGSLPSSTEANPRDQVKSISTTIEADSYPIRLKRRWIGMETTNSQSYTSVASHINEFQSKKEKGP
ncbi:hypothetical protein Tco_0540443 [Tanacetum coccineum]